MVDLVSALHQVGPEFVGRWDAARPARSRGMRTHVEHPGAGLLVLDGDVLQAPGCDVHLVVCPPEPGSRTADRPTRLVRCDTDAGAPVV